ncbi:MAG: PRC-barrel domain-containing protein, partial [Nitrospira sp.]|nr:PRC-barrel domain-containing protein [Nitrospira sp.]
HRISTQGGFLMALHTGRRLLAASTIEGTPVQNQAGEDLGEINELMIDLEKGRIAYAVLSFGGFLGLGDKLFALPWEALTMSAGGDFFILNVSRERLEQAEGFDKDRWPDMADTAWGERLHTYYGYKPYW